MTTRKLEDTHQIADCGSRSWVSLPDLMVDDQYDEAARQDCVVPPLNHLQPLFCTIRLPWHRLVEHHALHGTLLRGCASHVHRLCWRHARTRSWLVEDPLRFLVHRSPGGHHTNTWHLVLPLRPPIESTFVPQNDPGAGCADGVCCDDACAGLCSSCLADDTNGDDGVCDFIAADTDPADECMMGDCDGGGMCKMN